MARLALKQAAAQRSAANSAQFASDLECRAGKRDRKVWEKDKARLAYG